MSSELKTSGEPVNCILREQVRLALEQVPTMQAVSFIVSLVLCYAVRNEVSPGNIAAWVLLILSVVIGRTILYYRFERVKKERFDAAVWRNIYLGTTLLSGIFWGLSAFVLFSDGYSPLLSDFVLVLVSLSAAAAISHASIKFGPIAWAGPALLPYALRFSMQMTELGVVTSFLIVLFLYGIFRISLIHQNSISSGIALRFQNLELVDELQKANGQLRRDILERKRSEEAVIRAKDEWETTFNSVPDLIALIDDKHGVIRVNKAMAEKLGTSIEGAVGLKCHELVHGMEHPPLFCPHLQLLKDGQEHTAEIYEERWNEYFLVSTTPLRDLSGRSIGCVHIARDITRIKRVEKALKVSNGFLEISHRHEELCGLIEEFVKEIKKLTRLEAVAIRISGVEGQSSCEVSDGFKYPLSTLDEWADKAELRDSRILAYETFVRIAIESEENLLGYIYAADERKAMLSKDHAELLQIGAMHIGTAVQKVLAKESLKRAREELEKRVEARTGDLSIAKEQLEAEICERRRIEEELRRESAFREAVILNAKEGMSVWRPIEEYPYIRFTVWNRAMEKITGYTMEDINRLGWAQTMHDDPAMQASALEIMWNALAKDELSRLGRSIKRADGEMRDLIISSSPFRPAGEQAYVIALMYDFTELKRAENGLRQSEAQFRGLVENIGVGILIVQDGRIVYRNAEQASLSGSPTSESDRLEDLAENIHADDRPLLEALLACSRAPGATRTEVVLRFLSPGVGKTPVTRWVSCRCGEIEYQGRPARLIHMIDISELKKLERLMMLRGKMVSLGHVAAGIAHEIRNPLSGINVYLDAIRECYQDPEYSEDVLRLVQEAQGASNRIESVIKRVLDFSRPTEVNMRPTSINETIGDALKLVSVTLRKAGIVLELDLEADLPQIFADSQLIEQLVLNLVTNAAEVLKVVPDKRLIRIATRMENGYVSIRVEDSGPGIPKEMREEVFEPFFTTRGQGMGIGLVICKRIAADHRGEITITTSPLGGAQFNIMIPVEKRKSPR